MRKKIDGLQVIAILFCLFTFTLSGCKKNYYPKPYGYFRVDLPEHGYMKIDSILPFQFEMSNIADIHIKKGKHEKNWIDIVYPKLNATIHCSYIVVKNDINELSEDAHRSVYKHLVRADDITEQFFNNPDKKVYGIYYDLKGNMASVAQFVLTDSVNHFFRGAVYFNHVPNKDSIAPMSDYIKQDVIRLMESFSWK